MRNVRPIRRSILLATLVVAALTVAAAPAAVAATKAPPTVTVVKVKGLGKILADAEGMALYTFTANGQPVPCADACATAWPPLTVDGTPKGAKGVKKLGVTDTGQVTQAGLPLYLFAADTTKGQAAGEGINSFGGTWQVVKVGGTASRSTSSTSGGVPGY